MAFFGMKFAVGKRIANARKVYKRSEKGLVKIKTMRARRSSITKNPLFLRRLKRRF